MRAIIVNDKVIALRHPGETEKLVTMRAERLAREIGVETVDEPAVVDTERDAFEAWFKKTNPEVHSIRTQRNKAGGYFSSSTEELFSCWKAAILKGASK